jgi:hypothetical protein
MKIMNKIILKTSTVIGLAVTLLLSGNSAQASTYHGTINANSNTISGNLGDGIDAILASAPIATPVAGIYDSAKSVTLVAQGSSKIYYTLNDLTAPTCATGTLYSGAIAVNTSTVIQAIACYVDSQNVTHPSTVASYAYGITPPTTVTVNNSGGGGGGGGSSVSMFSKGDSNGDNKVNILDFVALMANWGQTGSGNLADFNSDGKVDIIDFVTLMANWTN